MSRAHTVLAERGRWPSTPHRAHLLPLPQQQEMGASLSREIGLWAQEHACTAEEGGRRSPQNRAGCDRTILQVPILFPHQMLVANSFLPWKLLSDESDNLDKGPTSEESQVLPRTQQIGSMG